MSYISRIFDRLDIQQIRQFLLYGTESMDISNAPYKQRLEDAEKIARKKIEEKFPMKEEYKDILGDIEIYTSTAQDVYMEIGMQCGAMLTIQLLTGSKME